MATMIIYNDYLLLSTIRGNKKPKNVCISFQDNWGRRGWGGKVLSPILSLHDPNIDARNLRQICNSSCKNL
jgi:hypothetical protein